MPVINILCQTKRRFAFSKIGFCAGTKVFEEALNAFKFLGWLKKFGPAQNILGPVKGQGIILQYETEIAINLLIFSFLQKKSIYLVDKESSFLAAICRGLRPFLFLVLQLSFVRIKSKPFGMNFAAK